MHCYLIKYISGHTLSECLDSETAANQIVACKRFKERKPHARKIRIKSRSGVWINHYIESE